MFNKMKLAVLAFLALAFTSPAFAAVDVTATVSEITAALTPIGAIGIAVLGVLVAIKVYKWVRRAM